MTTSKPHTDHIRQVCQNAEEGREEVHWVPKSVALLGVIRGKVPRSPSCCFLFSNNRPLFVCTTDIGIIMFLKSISPALTLADNGWCIGEGVHVFLSCSQRDGVGTCQVSSLDHRLQRDVLRRRVAHDHLNQDLFLHREETEADCFRTYGTCVCLFVCVCACVCVHVHMRACMHACARM